ncbi:TPR_REGION domain-containing protein, partial [Haematococcus lacustris]
KQEALQDAQAAVDLAPPDFVNGWVRLIDCQYACGDTQAAISTLSRALKACPTFAGIREYKAIVQALGVKGRRIT